MNHTPAFLPERQSPIDPAKLNAAMAEFVSLLGADRVLIGDAASEYRDPYQPEIWDAFTSEGVLQPDTTEQVQEIVRIAAKHGVHIWSQGQGRNNGYGGAAPRLSGSVTLNFRRMNRVLTINEDLGYALIEPGVSFQDLYDALEAQGSNLMVSVPDLGWGSLGGNSLENGLTYLPVGKDFMAICGLEVVTSDGELLRTNMGAMENNESWNIYRRSMGPSLDALFTQSSFGIVTKLGIWLMPKPEVITHVDIDVFRDEDLGPMVDILRKLRMDGTIDGVPCILNTLLIASTIAPRSAWYDGPTGEPIPDEAIDIIAAKIGIGRWHLRLALYGDRPVNEHNLAKIEREFGVIPGVRILSKTNTPGDAAKLESGSDRVYAGVPNLDWTTMAGWNGGERGGHMSFAPVVPLTGEKVLWLQRWLRDKYAEAGLDYTSDIIVGNARSACAVSGITFNFDNEEETAVAYQTMQKLVAEAGKLGYGEYRAHLHFMDLAQDQYGFNNHAYRRFVEKIKDAVDPQGIFSPGKQGIWPAAMRG